MKDRPHFLSLRWILLSALLIKLALLPFVQVTDADAVSRVFMAMQWNASPEWIESSVWGPFHTYLNGMWLMLWPDAVVAPAVLNILLSVLTLIPFYRFTKREFNEDGAAAVTLLMAFSPVIFRNNFMALSETPYLLFMAAALDQVSVALQSRSMRAAILGGLMITIGSGFRLEAWMLGAILSIVVLLKGNAKLFFAYGLTAAIWPVIWMVQSYLSTGSFFYSAEGNSEWTLEVMKNNEDLDLESYLRRIWYFPFILLISLGPVAAWFFVRGTTEALRSRKGLIWLLPFFTFLLFFEYNGIKGLLLLQNRFVCTLVLLSLPFAANGFAPSGRIRLKLTALALLLMTGLSFLYNVSDITPVPRLKDQRFSELAKMIRENSAKEDGLILDFCGWEGSYFVALNSGKRPEDLVLFYPSSPQQLPEEQLLKNLETHQKGVLMLKEGTSLSGWIESQKQQRSDIRFHALAIKDELQLISWSR